MAKANPAMVAEGNDGGTQAAEGNGKKKVGVFWVTQVDGEVRVQEFGTAKELCAAITAAGLDPAGEVVFRGRQVMFVPAGYKLQ